MTDLYEQARDSIASAQDYVQSLRSGTGAHPTIDGLHNELGALSTIVQQLTAEKPNKTYRMDLHHLDDTTASFRLAGENPFERSIVTLRLERSEWEALGRPSTIDVPVKVHRG